MNFKRKKKIIKNLNNKKKIYLLVKENQKSYKVRLLKVFFSNVLFF